MRSNFVKFQEILNQTFAENFICLTHKLVNPLVSIFVFPIWYSLLKIAETLTTKSNCMDLAIKKGKQKGRRFKK